MPYFRYAVRDHFGPINQGLTKAETAEELRLRLEEQGFEVPEIREIGDPANFAMYAFTMRNAAGNTRSEIVAAESIEDLKQMLKVWDYELITVSLATRTRIDLGQGYYYYEYSAPDAKIEPAPKPKIADKPIQKSASRLYRFTVRDMTGTVRENPTHDEYAEMLIRSLEAQGCTVSNITKSTGRRVELGHGYYYYESEDDI